MRSGPSVCDPETSVATLVARLRRRAAGGLRCVARLGARCVLGSSVEVDDIALVGDENFSREASAAAARERPRSLPGSPATTLRHSGPRWPPTRTACRRSRRSARRGGGAAADSDAARHRCASQRASAPLHAARSNMPRATGARPSCRLTRCARAVLTASACAATLSSVAYVDSHAGPQSKRTPHAGCPRGRATHSKLSASSCVETRGPTFGVGPVGQYAGALAHQRRGRSRGRAAARWHRSYEPRRVRPGCPSPRSPGLRR